MLKKITISSVFMFYFLFVISYFDSNLMSYFRYVGIGTLLVVSIFINVYSKKKTISNYYYNILLSVNYLLLIVILITAFYSEYQSSSIVKFFSTMLLVVIVMYVIPQIINYIGLKKFYKVSIDSMTVSILISFLLKPNGRILNYASRASDSESRLTLFFYHPNLLGSMCLITFLMIQFYIFNYKRNLKKPTIYMYVFISIFLFALLYLSDSRTSLYGIIIFEILILYNQLLKNKISKIILSLILFPITITSVTYFIKDISIENLNFLLSNRLYLWADAIEILSYNGRFFIGMGSYLNSQINQYDLTLIDNGYIYMIFQNGLISLSIMLFLFLLIVVFLRRIANDFKGNFIISLFVLYLFVGIFENSLFNLSNLMTVFVLSNVYYFIKYSYLETKGKVELYENSA